MAEPSLYEPAFPEDWCRQSLLSLARWTNGLAFRDIHFSASGMPVIKIAEAKTGLSQQTRYTKQSFGDDVHVRSGDLIFSWSGQPETSIDAFWWRGPEGWLNQHLFRVTASESMDQVFLFYLLRYLKPTFVRIARNKQTTGLGHVTRQDMEALQVGVPHLSEQRAIAEVLGALDDKIEANRRVADVATNLALAQATSALEDVEGTPTDMEQIADITKGVSYRSDDLTPGDGWLVSLKCVGRDGSFKPGGLKPFSGLVKPSQVVDDGDVLVAQTDLTQKAEVIGRPIRVERLGLAGRFAASLDFAIVRPRSPLTREVLFGLLNQGLFREHALGFCNGTTVLHMNSRALPSYQVAVPGAEQMCQLTNIMKPLLERSSVARRECSYLASLRDALLSELMSGQLGVRDAEHLAEEAV